MGCSAKREDHDQHRGRTVLVGAHRHGMAQGLPCHNELALQTATKQLNISSHLPSFTQEMALTGVSLGQASDPLRHVRTLDK
jgi:hypothetical protein